MKEPRLREAFDAVSPDEAACARMWAAIDAAYEECAAAEAGAGAEGAEEAAAVAEGAAEAGGEGAARFAVTAGGRSRRMRRATGLAAVAAVLVLAVGVGVGVSALQGGFMKGAPEAAFEPSPAKSAQGVLAPEVQDLDAPLTSSECVDGFVEQGNEHAVRTLLITVEPGFTAEDKAALCDRHGLTLGFAHADLDAFPAEYDPALTTDELEALRAALLAEPGVLRVE